MADDATRTLHLVWVRADDNYDTTDDLMAAYEDPALAQAYADRYPAPMTAWLQPFEVSTTVPALLTHHTFAFNGQMHRTRGVKWWEGDLTPENLRTVMVQRFDADAVPQGYSADPVVVDGDPDGHLQVSGTDEALVRATFVRIVQDYLDSQA